MGIRLSSRAIIIHDKKILLNQMGNGVYYNFPGGQIEENETALEAVVREVLEETGYSVEVDEYIFTFEYEANHCAHFEGEGHRVHLFFRCRLKDVKKEYSVHPDGDPNDSSIKSKPVWVSLSELNSTTFVPSAIKESLLEYINSGIFKPQYFECSKP